MKLKKLILSLTLGALALPVAAEEQKVTFTRTELSGIGVEDGVMRRDPSAVIKVGAHYDVWYSKGKISPGYDAKL